MGNTVRYEYNALDRLASVLDARMDITRYVYDSYGHLTEVNTDVDDADTAKVQYTYEDDELKTISMDGAVYSFESDGFGNNTSVSVNDRMLVSREYEAYNGELKSMTYGNGYVYLYDYDDRDRLVQIRMKDMDGKEFLMYRYEYDGEGNLCTEYDIREDIDRETIVTRYFYDLSGRLIYYRNDRDEDYRHTYDVNNHITKVENGNTFRKTQTCYAYDADGRETVTTTDTGAKYETVYDGLGRVQKKNWTASGNTFAQASYTYATGGNGSQSNQLKKMTYGNSEISYEYDRNGNIARIETEDGVIQYKYDELYRLTREDNQIQDYTIEYIYDFDGNLYQKRIHDYIPETDLWALGEVVPKKQILYEYDEEWQHLLKSYDGQTITYDGIGNPLQYRGMELEWVNGRELNHVTKDGQSITYRYSKNGMRNRKYLSDGTVIYQNWGNKIIGEQKIGSDQETLMYELEYFYDSVGNIISMLYNGTEYYYLKNIQGDIIGILDGNGASVVEYTYDSWGKLLTISGDQELGKRNPFRYRGYYYDEETGFYYVRSRYYDAEVGRFISADGDISGIGGDIRGYNLYSYCFNNPVNMSDPSGNWPKLSTIFIGVAVAAVVVAAVAVCVATAPVMAGIGVTSSAAAVAANIATMTMYVAGVSATAALVTKVVENTSTKKKYRNQSVYVMRNSITKEVQYVGRTNNPIRRQKEHGRDPKKTHLDPLEVKFTGLTRIEAQVMEQIVISTYIIQNLDNARREIAVGNISGFTGKMNNIINIFGGVTESELLNLMGR